MNIYELVELRTSVVVMPGAVLTAAAHSSLKCTKLTMTIYVLLERMVFPCRGLTWLKVGTDVGWVLALAGHNSHQFQIRLVIRIHPKWIEFSKSKIKIKTATVSFSFKNPVHACVELKPKPF